MIKTFVKAVAPLLTAVASSGLVWCLLRGPKFWIPTVVASVLVIMFCSTAFNFGEMSLPEHPTGALTLMELERGTYWVVGAVGAALVIRVGLLFPGDLKGADKELIGALSAGATAFVTAMFASVSDEKADATLADRIKSAFQSRYLRPGKTPDPAGLKVHWFAAGSAGERYVHAGQYLDIKGWDRAARKKRAAGIATELKNGTSDPPVTAS